MGCVYGRGRGGVGEKCQVAWQNLSCQEKSNTVLFFWNLRRDGNLMKVATPALVFSRGVLPCSVNVFKNRPMLSGCLLSQSSDFGEGLLSSMKFTWGFLNTHFSITCVRGAGRWKPPRKISENSTCSYFCTPVFQSFWGRWLSQMHFRACATRHNEVFWRDLNINHTGIATKCQRRALSQQPFVSTWWESVVFDYQFGLLRS